MPNDPFSVLGVTSSATEDEIKAAYRKLAKKYHPDLNPGDKAAEQKMREVNEAYTRALQIKKTGRDPYQNTYGSSILYSKQKLKQRMNLVFLCFFIVTVKPFLHITVNNSKPFLYVSLFYTYGQSFRIGKNIDMIFGLTTLTVIRI